jgi:PAS domain S-box-containing protein
LPPEQIEYVRNTLAEIIETGNTATYYTTYYPPDGSPVYYETRAIPRVINNEIVGALLSSRDITDRVLADQRIRYQANLLQNISDAVISEDLDFRIMSWNWAAEKTYGWKSSEVIGNQLMELLHNEYSEMTREEVLEILNKTGTWNGQIDQTKKDGSKITVLSAVSYIHDANGSPIGVVSVNHDITERLTAQHDLQSERDRAMLYLDVMGHDIRNKLQTITIGLEIIETLAPANSEADVFSDIQDAVEKCSHIIRETY